MVAKDSGATESRPARGGRARAPTGAFRGGLPSARFGDGPQPLVVFQGLTPENKADKMTAMLYRYLECWTPA